MKAHRTASSLRVAIDHGPDEGQSDATIRARLGQRALEAWEHDATPRPDWRVNVEGRQAAWHRCLDDQAMQTDGITLIATSNGAARFAHPDAGRLRTGVYGNILIAPEQAPHGVAWDVWP